MLEVRTLTTSLVPGPVPYALLRPEPLAPGQPVLLWLHGGNGSHAFLEQTRPLFERLWANGELPPMAVATPSAGRSFYLDTADGKARWETFLLAELLPEVRRVAAAADSPSATAIAGVSMGGLGSLRTAFRHPEAFAAVAAVEPGVEPTERWLDVLRRDRVYRPDALLALLFGDPFDADHFLRNHPLHLIDRNGPAIVAAGLAISIECGDEDALHLFHGAAALHRRLFERAIPHEYRLVRGGDHVGPTVAPRLAEALRFVGRALRREVPEPSAELDFLRKALALLEISSGYRAKRTVAGPAGAIEVDVVGDGPPVVLLPSLGRGAGDFADLATRLARAGYCAIAPQPRGVGGTAGLAPSLSLAELAADIAAVVSALAGGRAVVAGHAFGNRVARMTAAEHPALVAGVACLAAGGLVPPPAAATAALHAVFDPRLDAEAHAAAVAAAFFAPGNAPRAFLDGWHAELAAAQRHATETTPVERWWLAGTAPILVVQAEHDAIAVAENAERLAAAASSRVEIVRLPRAGHAMLPEQPAAVATALLGWLARLPRAERGWR